MGTAVEGNNRDEYRRASTIGTIRLRRGNWIDGGERLIVNEIADEFRGRAILDVGVGTGRTAWLMRLISDDYVALDWSPEMVETCRQDYPGLDARVADARDLSSFPDERFDLVFFSCNGLDVLGHDGRTSAVAEAYRVLKPGGLFLYSTSNKLGGLYQRRPWRSPQRGFLHFVKRLARLPVSLPRRWRAYLNWWRKRRYAEDHGGWATCTAGPYEFGLVYHFTLPSTEAAALAAAGFRSAEFRDNDGAPLEGDASTCNYFYVLARK